MEHPIQKSERYPKIDEIGIMNTLFFVEQDTVSVQIGKRG